MSIKSFRFTISILLAFTAFVATIFVAYVVAKQKHDQYRISVGLQETCQSNLNNIAIALRNYKESFGCFPQPFSTNRTGQRTQSWRATILPWFPFDNPLATEYHFVEPWNSIENSKFSRTTPAFYRCPSHKGSDVSKHVAYFMMNDFSGNSSSSIPSNAVLVVEVGNANVGWCDPYGDMDGRAQADSIVSSHPSGFGVILCDYSRLRLKDSKRIKKQGQFYVVVD